jgi:hypothetical protein
MANHPPLRQIIDGIVWYGVWNSTTRQYDWTAIGPGPGAALGARRARAKARPAKAGARAKTGARAKARRKSPRT